MNYETLNNLLVGRCANRKKLAHNTYAKRRGSYAIAVRLHNTDIILFSKDGTIRYNTNGWRTVTTKERLNRFGPVGVYQRNYEWFLSDGTPFEDDMVVKANHVY